MNFKFSPNTFFTFLNNELVSYKIQNRDIFLGNVVHQVGLIWDKEWAGGGGKNLAGPSIVRLSVSRPPPARLLWFSLPSLARPPRKVGVNFVFCVSACLQGIPAPRCCHHFGRGQNFRLLSMLLFFLKFLTQVVYISHRFLVFGLILLQFHPSSVCILQLSSVQDCKLKANIGRASLPVSVQSTQPNGHKTDHKGSSAT